MDAEEAARQNKLNEQEILRQCIEDRNRLIYDLEKKVEVLEGMLNRLATAKALYPQPQPQPLPAIRPVPRRWSVK